MKKRERENGGLVCALAALVMVAVMVQPALASIGEPQGFLAGGTYGTASIRISQGGTDLVNTDFVFPADIKVNDGDPEDYVVLDTWGTGTTETQIILKVVSEGSAVEPMDRIIHWYIDSIVPGEPSLAGPLSLFAPFDSVNPNYIDVEISNIDVIGTAQVSPLIYSQPTYLASYLMREGGLYYDFGADTNDYVSHASDVQVPGTQYNDGDHTHYDFEAAANQTAPVSWKWKGLVPPALSTPAVDNSGTFSTPNDGRVFECGLSMVLTPEPATALLALLAAPVLLRRRRGG